MKIPVIGLGTWQIGGLRDADYSQDDFSISSIKKAIDLGYTLIDTAEIYGDGHCEEIVGKAITGYDRKKLFIVSKVFKSNLKYDDLLKSTDGCLKRLGIDYFDLFLIHAPNPNIPIEETMRAMNHLVDIGKAKSIGVSNFSLKRLKEAQACSKHPIVVNQIEYSLITRNEGSYGDCNNMEKEVVPYCQEQGIIIMAERPVERGALAQKGFPILDTLSEKYNKTRAQIAINWLISKKNIITIPKSTNETRLKENLETMGWQLAPEDMQALDNYKFDDIVNVTVLKSFVQDIVKQAVHLKDKHTTEKDALVNYAAIFTQTEESYKKILELTKQIGEIIKDTPTGPLFKINLTTRAGTLRLLKIRSPDKTRTEKGDADFTIKEFDAFKKLSLNKPEFKLITRPTMEMIELMDPAYHVRAYFSNPPLDEQLDL